LKFTTISKDYYYYYYYNEGRYSSVGIALGYGLNDRGSRVRFPAGLGIFLFTAYRTALGPTQPPIQWVPGALFLGLKRPVREADHSPPSSVEVKNAWSYTFTPQYVFMAWCLTTHRDNFTFCLNYYSSTHSLNSALDGGEWSASRSGATYQSHYYYYYYYYYIICTTAGACTFSITLFRTTSLLCIAAVNMWIWMNWLSIGSHEEPSGCR
jgi:hypothetical protein